MQSLKTYNMTKIIAFIFLILNFGCTTNNHKSTPIENSKTTNDVLDYPFQTKKIINEAFEVYLQIDSISIDKYALAATMKLDEGSYIISPFSKDDFYLPFTITIDDSKFLQPSDELFEFPMSVEELDTIINKQVRFVRANTTFTQNLNVMSQEDFEVAGLIEFLIEPQCIPYDVEFVISKNSGEVKVEKTKVFISKEYKL